jgi:hypothetical protein
MGKKTSQMRKTGYRQKSWDLIELTLDSMTKTEEDLHYLASRMWDWLAKYNLLEGNYGNSSIGSGRKKSGKISKGKKH